MTSATSASPKSSRRAAVWITLGVIVALMILFFICVGLYANVLWYQQLGFLSVLTTQWVGGLTLFFAGFFGMAIPLWVCLIVAYRARPLYAKLNSQVDRYQQVIEPLRRFATYGIPILFGLFAGAASASNWKTAALWLNGTPFHTVDPVFHLDLSFYVFALPLYRSVVGFSSAVVLIALLLTFVTSYIYGSIRFAPREVRVTRAARVQMCTIAAVYFAIQAVSIWLDRYSTVTDSNVNGMINGASYADVNATIPGRAILAGAALFVAALFVVTVFLKQWRLALVGTGLLIVAAIIIGVIYPWGVQRFEVVPNQKSLETPYIQRAITATRAAYGLSSIDVIPYNATTTAQAGALKQDAQTTAQIRIMDPAIISPTFQQLQQFRQYYSFPKTLSVDRYTIDGKQQDAIVAVRELDQSGLSSNSWFNDTMVYTHGYGLVAAYGNQRSNDGLPVFMESGIPSQGALGSYQPRVYFGLTSPTYSIVGAPPGSKPVELDYPGGGGSSQQTYTTYTGNGGPKLDNFFNRLVYALKFQDEQILLSNSINNDSQILYDRNPLTRVHQVAPYLTLDSSPYPAIVNGQIEWIIDGYTTSDQYPYSYQSSLSADISDNPSADTTYAFDNINYIRNSVKATVNAYTGKVTLYAWDPSDPVLKTWEKIYPGTVKPISDMSGQLMSHVRYPSDLFKVQRTILGQYHVTDPTSFYNRDNVWRTPPDPTSSSGDSLLQSPYYLTMKVPGQSSPAFTLYTTFIPQGTTDTTRSVLKGYLAVDSDAGSVKGVIGSGYGTLRLLQLPTNDTIPGPGQVQNMFTSDSDVSSKLNLLKQGDTQVIRGNLLTLPVGGGLLYVQPVFVKSTGETSYPTLQKVLVAFGDNIAFEDTLDQALDVLFGGNSGANAGDSGVVPDTSGSTSSDTSSADSGSSDVNNTALQQALAQAKQALADRQTALQQGNWAAYGAADQRLQDALNAAIAAAGTGSK